ncbi:MAG: phosphate ABC transporter permease PstA [Actinomycetota bacterium]
MNAAGRIAGERAGVAVRESLAGRRNRSVAAGVFLGYLLLSTVVGLVALAVLLATILQDGLPYLDAMLFTNSPSADPERAGARPAIIASILVAVVLIATALPIAVGTAVYLEEFAPKGNRLIDLIELNIQNLAAVPSIIFGILGLAFLVRGMDLGPVLLAGALILGLQMLPTVIIASREALRAVPDSVRQGGMALGATRWQVVWREVLPAAIPGIATGSILGMSRAIGETAPLLMVGAATFVSFNPGLLTQYTVLPILIYQWIKLPQEMFQGLAAAAIIVLLVILVAMNGFAIWMRNRYERKW